MPVHNQKRTALLPIHLFTKILKKVKEIMLPTFKTQDDILKDLASKVNENEQFFLGTRRGAPLSRTISLWKRGLAKSKANSL